MLFAVARSLLFRNCWTEPGALGYCGSWVGTRLWKWLTERGYGYIGGKEAMVEVPEETRLF